MTFREIVHRAIRDAAPRRRRMRTLSLGLPLLPAAPRGKAHRCRICGAPVSADSDTCADCRIPFSARLADLRVLCEARTRGRWRAGEDHDTAIVRAERVIDGFGSDFVLVADDLLPHDARFLAAVANTLPELLAEYDRMRSALLKGTP